MLAWCFPYHRWLQHANELPRIFMTMAIAEEGSFGIDTYRQRFGYAKAMDISRSLCLGPRLVGALRVRVSTGSGRPVTHVPAFEDPRGPPCRERYFSNKAPGQSMLALPGYELQRALWRLEARRAGPGRVSGSDLRSIRDPDTRADRLRQAIRLARLTTATLPAFLFLLLLAWWLRPWIPDPHVRRAAVAAYGLGTLAFTYSVQLMSHQLATALCFTGFILIGSVARGRLGASGPRAAIWLALSGLVSGTALACDYQLVLGAAVLAIYALAVVRPLPRVLWAGLGALPPIGLLLYYHHAAFGAINWTGYEFLIAGHDQALHARGLLGMTRPTAEALWGSLFRPDNGLFYFSPWLLVALLGMGALWRLPGGSGPGPRSPDDGRRAWVPSSEAAFSLGLVALYIYFIGSIAFWRGGWQTGPRYVAAMLPAFVLPYALLLQKVRDRPLAWAAALAPALFALVAHALVVTGFPHFPEKFKYPLFDLVGPLISDGYVSYTLGTWLFGHSRVGALLPYLLLLSLLVGYLAVGRVRLRGPASARGGGRIVAGVLAVVLAVSMARGYEILAERGISRAKPLPALGKGGERYGDFLKRAHGDIRRNWEPGPLSRRDGKRPRLAVPGGPR
jgi:hypothetical protein